MPEMQKKLLIITADDLGYSDTRDDGIIKCYKTGSVSNASLMVNGLSAENAVKKATEVGLPMGLHLNLTEGSPISTPVPKSLLGPDGFMLGKMGLREAINQGQVNLSEVVNEIQAQIDRFEKLTGSKPINIDGHQHIHVYPGMCEIFAETLYANGVKLTRLPIEPNIDDALWDVTKAQFKSTVIQQAKDAVDDLWKSQIWSPAFTGLKTMGQDMTVSRLQACILEGLQGQTSSEHPLKMLTPSCELMVHPGNKTGNSGGCGNGPDSFSQSEDREQEMSVLQSEKMKDFYRQWNIKLGSFKDLVKISSS